MKEGRSEVEFPYVFIPTLTISHCYNLLIYLALVYVWLATIVDYFRWNQSYVLISGDIGLLNELIDNNTASSDSTHREMIKLARANYNRLQSLQTERGPIGRPNEPCIQGAPVKKEPLGKFDISGIVADIFTKFTEFTDEDSIHISCKFCSGSKEATV